MKKILGLVLFSLLCVNYSFAQESIFNSVFMQADPVFMGAGNVGAAINSDNVVGFHHNPAQLGNFAENNNIGIFFQPSDVKYVKKLSTGIEVNTYGAAIGYNFDKSGLPLSVGIGFLQTKFDYGNMAFYPGDNYERFSMFSIGAKYVNLLELNLGFGIKNLKDVVTNYKNRAYTATLNSFDFGLMITLPITKLWLKDVAFKVGEESKIMPASSFTVGYSLLNVGDGIDLYENNNRKEPIRRTAILGYSVNLGLDLIWRNTSIKMFNYSLAIEAEDNLALGVNNNEPEYDGIFGKIKPLKNLISLKGEEEIVLHKGHVFDFFETFTYAVGSFKGEGLDYPHNSAISFKTDGIFKFLSSTVTNNYVQYILKHVYLNYTTTTYFEKTALESDFSGMTIGFRGFVL